MAASEYHAGQEPGSVTMRENLTGRPVNRRLFLARSAAAISALSIPAAAAVIEMVPLEQQLLESFRKLSPKAQVTLVGWADWQVKYPIASEAAHA